MTIDLCERLPSLNEVNSIETKINDGSPGLPDNHEDILRACVDSENLEMLTAFFSGKPEATCPV